MVKIIFVDEKLSPISVLKGPMSVYICMCMMQVGKIIMSSEVNNTNNTANCTRCHKQ